MTNTTSSPAGAASAPDEHVSRVYRVDPATRRVVNGLLAVLSGVFLVLAILHGARVLGRPTSSGGLVWGDVSVAGLVLLLGSGINKRVILHPDAIEVVGWFSSRTLRFADIRGRQTTANSRLPYGYGYVLIPKQPGGRTLVLPSYLHTDQFFRDWIKAIPKLRR